MLNWSARSGQHVAEVAFTGTHPVETPAMHDCRRLIAVGEALLEEILDGIFRCGVRKSRVAAAVTGFPLSVA